MMVTPFENCSATNHQRMNIEKIWECLTDILPRRVQPIKVVQIGQGTEKVLGPAHAIPNHNPALARPLDLHTQNQNPAILRTTSETHLEHLKDRPIPFLDIPHDLLVNL
jgi:hypothetical protein